MGALNYNADVFAVADLEEAKRIIVTPSADMDTAERWARETPYFADRLGAALDIRPGQLIIDYGCGVGRLSKALIERFDCFVLGVDSSGQMRQLAPAYVQSARFSVVSRAVLAAMANQGLRADAAFAVWVLQHCLRPTEDIGLISSALREAAPMGVVNTWRRAVPTREAGWAHDGIDMRELLGDTFAEVEMSGLDADYVGEIIAQHAFFGLYRR